MLYNIDVCDITVLPHTLLMLRKETEETVAGSSDTGKVKL